MTTERLADAVPWASDALEAELRLGVDTLAVVSIRYPRGWAQAIVRCERLALRSRRVVLAVGELPSGRYSVSGTAALMGWFAGVGIDSLIEVRMEQPVKVGDVFCVTGPNDFKRLSDQRGSRLVVNDQVIMRRAEEWDVDERELDS